MDIEKDGYVYESIFAPFPLGAMALTRDVTEARTACPLHRANAALQEVVGSPRLPLASRCAAELLSGTIAAVLDEPATPVLRLVE